MSDLAGKSVSTRHTPLSDRFWSKVAKRGADECWLWTGKVTLYGYGTVRDNRRERKAHRTSWELANGPIPDGLCVLHRCDVPRCVNPKHLFLGTVADNIADMDAKKRRVPRGRGRSQFTAARKHYAARKQEQA